jgi:hypothetical protein
LDNAPSEQGNTAPGLCNWHGQTLKPEDWDFRNVPQDQLNACLDYERSREIVRWRKDAQDWKRKYGERKPRRGEVILGWIDELLPWFPDTPWLLIPNRTQVTVHFNGNSYFPILGETNPEHLKDDNGKLCSMVTRGGVSYVAFKIGWSWGEKYLTNAFKDWLHDFRAELREAKVKGVESRKSGPSRGRARDVLRAFGARRLIQAYGIDKACRVTRERLGDAPLYSEEHSAWYRAKSAADKYLETHCG